MRKTITILIVFSLPLSFLGTTAETTPSRTAAGMPSSCEDGKSEGWDQAYEDFTHRGCQLKSRIVTCPKGSWYTEYYSEPPCTAPSKTSAPTPVDSGEPQNAFIECSENQIKTITAAFKKARGWIENTDNQLSDFLAGPSSKSPTVAAALHKHFNLGDGKNSDLGTDTGEAQTVLKNIRTLEKNLGGFGGVCARSDSESPNSTKDLKRTGIAAAPSPNSNDFTYAPLFFKRTADQQATTIVHEMTHAWLGFDDNSYEDQAGYSGRSGVAIMNPASYGGFVRVVGQHP